MSTFVSAPGTRVLRTSPLAGAGGPCPAAPVID
jgi:hypothetical protein